MIALHSSGVIDHGAGNDSYNSQVTEFTKLASSKWKVMSAEEKKPWDERAALDKQRYEREMDGYHPPPGMSGPKSRKKVSNCCS